jgi:hypothetical protein
MEPDVFPSRARWPVTIKHGGVVDAIGIGGGGRGGRFRKKQPSHFMIAHRLYTSSGDMAGAGSVTATGYGTLTIQWSPFDKGGRVTCDPDFEPETTKKKRGTREQWTVDLGRMEGGDGIRVPVLPPKKLQGKESGGCALQGFFLSAGKEREIMGRKVSAEKPAIYMVLSLKQKTPLKAPNIGVAARELLWAVILDDKGMYVDMMAPTVGGPVGDSSRVYMAGNLLNTEFDSDKFIELDGKKVKDVRASVPLGDLPGPGKYQAIVGLGPFVPDKERPPPKDYWMGEVISAPVEIVIPE